MASIRERNGKFNVIYSYTNEKGERKQKWETYETKAEAKRRKKEIEYKKEMAKKYDCPFVDNEMPYGRVPQGHPVIVDYFYHEEIRGTENTGKRNR